MSTSTFHPIANGDGTFTGITVWPSFSCTNNVAVKIAQHKARVLRGGKKTLMQDATAEKRRKRSAASQEIAWLRCDIRCTNRTRCETLQILWNEEQTIQNEIHGTHG